MRKRVFKILAIILGMGISEYFLSLPFRFIENWAMGLLADRLQRDWHIVVSFMIIWVIPFVIICGLVWLGYLLGKNRTTKQTIITQAQQEKSENLTETLTMMHRRLVDLQKEKASHTSVSIKQIEKASWTFLDKSGLVLRKDKPKFMKQVRRRVQRSLPRRPFRHSFRFKEWAEYRQIVREGGLVVGLELKKELLASLKWTLNDGLKLGEWLDDYGWGVKKLRDNDSIWVNLWNEINDYLKDETLRDLVSKHVDTSYIYNNTCLIGYYSERLANRKSFLTELHAVLVGSPISLDKADLALSEVLNEIEKRLAEIQRQKKIDKDLETHSLPQTKRLASTIEVHECSLEPARPFYLTLVVRCTITVPTVPVNIASLKLYVGNWDNGEPTFPNLPITIGNSPDSYVIKYEVRTSLIGSENPSYISALARGERFASQRLPIPYDNPLLPRQII